MEEKPLQSTLPPPTDIETSTASTTELRRKRRLKIVVYIALFIVFQTLVITAFASTVMRIRRPRFRLQSVNIQDLNIKNSTDSPSFTMKLDAEISVKNRNFGPYKFHSSFLTLSYKEFPVGEAVISGSNVKIFSTKKMKISMNVDSQSVSKKSNLGKEISSGILEFTGVSNLTGQIELLKLMKKDKAANMNCSIIIDLGKKVVQQLRCD